MTTDSTDNVGCLSGIAAYQSHTAYLRWRAVNPSADRLLHDAFWQKLSNHHMGIPVSVQEREQRFAESRAFHNLCRVTDDVILSHADTVYLSADIHELVSAALETMPDEVLFRTDAHTPCAMMFLEHPIEVQVGASIMAADFDEVVERVVAVGGTITGERAHSEPIEGRYNGIDRYLVRAISWADIDSVSSDVQPEIIRRLRGEVGSAEVAKMFSASGMLVNLYGNIVSSTIDGVTMMATELHLSGTSDGMIIIDTFTVSYGEDGLSIDRDTSSGLIDSDDLNTHRYFWARRYLVALLRLMNEYVDVGTSRVPRPFARSATRAGRKESSNGITSLSLRRGLYEHSGSSTGRKVSLAHLVRGHWRNQWYPSQQTHRARWIAAHRRGGAPTDEVLETHRVFSVNR